MTAPVKWDGQIIEVNIRTGEFQVEFDGPIGDKWFLPQDPLEGGKPNAVWEGRYERGQGHYPKSGDNARMWYVL